MSSGRAQAIKQRARQDSIHRADMSARYGPVVLHIEARDGYTQSPLLPHQVSHFRLRDQLYLLR